jgi:hypothetical protein
VLSLIIFRPLFSLFLLFKYRVYVYHLKRNPTTTTYKGNLSQPPPSLSSEGQFFQGRCSHQLHKTCTGSNMEQTLTGALQALSNAFYDNKVPIKTTLHRLLTKFRDTCLTSDSGDWWHAQKHWTARVCTGPVTPSINRPHSWLKPREEPTNMLPTPSVRLTVAQGTACRRLHYFVTRKTLSWWLKQHSQSSETITDVETAGAISTANLNCFEFASRNPSLWLPVQSN